MNKVYMKQEVKEVNCEHGWVLSNIECLNIKASCSFLLWPAALLGFIALKKEERTNIRYVAQSGETAVLQFHYQ